MAKLTRVLTPRAHVTIPAGAKYVLAQLSSRGGAPFPLSIAELVEAFVQVVCSYARPHDGMSHKLYLLGFRACQWFDTTAAGQVITCDEGAICDVCLTAHSCAECDLLYCAKHTGAITCRLCGDTFLDSPNTCTGCTVRHVRDRHSRRCCALARSTYHSVNVLCCRCAERDTTCCLCGEHTCDLCAARTCTRCDAPLQFCESHSEQLLTCVESVDHYVGNMCDECSSWVCRCGRRWCVHCHPNERCPTCFGLRNPSRKRKLRESMEGLEVPSAAAPGSADPNPENLPSRKK